MLLLAISGTSLMTTMVLCLVGIFTPARVYDDTFLQRLGMSGTFLFCFGRFRQLVEFGAMTGNCLPVSVQLVGHVGLALFAMGTAWRAVRDYRRRIA